MSTIWESDAPPPSSVVALRTLVEAFELLRCELARVLGAEGLPVSPLHMRVLMWCSHFPGTNQQAIGDAIGRDKSQVARLVKELESKGLLTRDGDPNDKRSYTLRATSAGGKACRVFERVELGIAQKMFPEDPAESLQSFIEGLREAGAHLQSGTHT